MTTAYPIECARCGQRKPRGFKFCPKCYAIVQTEQLKPNTCDEQDCNEVIDDEHYLCRVHWQQFREGKISECPECGEHKPANYALCRLCNAQSGRQPGSHARNPRPDGNSPRQQTSNTRRPYEYRDGEDDAKAKDKRYWFNRQDNGVCNYCGNRYFYHQLEMEHMIPKELGGPDHRRNMQLACKNCNSLKGTSTDIEFRQLNAHLIPTEERTPPRRPVDPKELKPGTQGTRYRERPMPGDRGSSAEGSSEPSQATPPRDHHGRPPSERERRFTTGLLRGVDVRTVLSWLGLSAALGVIFGYVIGFKAAQPVLEDFFGPLGLITVGIVALALTCLVLCQWWWRARQMVSLGSLWRSLWPLAGDLKRTLIWVCCGVVVSGPLGGVLGYVSGFQTAQGIYDMAASLGMIVLAIIIVVAAVLIMFALLMNMVSSDQSSRRSRRSGRR